VTDPASTPPAGPPEGRGRVHAGLALATVLCVPAFFFELSRAIGGNALSWAYVFEWPVFEAFAIYMWWKLLHEDERASHQEATASPLSAAEQQQLDAWNAYLEELGAEEGDS
jgi:hypothetical protein